MKQSLSFQVAGGPLGGTLNYFRPNLESIAYIPHTRRTALGLRAQLGWIYPFVASRCLWPLGSQPPRS